MGQFINRNLQLGIWVRGLVSSLSILAFSFSSYAQDFVSVCDRTPQIRDAIVQLAREQLNKSNCAELTKDDLAGIELNRRSEILQNKCIDSLKPGDFSGMTAVTFLSLTGNNLTTIGKGVFEDLANLAVLEINENLLKDANFLSSLNMQSLASVILGKNFISEIGSNWFAQLHQVRYLDLSFNRISSLDASSFRDLPSLFTLDINNNRFSAISAEVFAENRNLEMLAIGNPFLEEIADYTFLKIINLRRLFLGFTSWEYNRGPVQNCESGGSLSAGQDGGGGNLAAFRISPLTRTNRAAFVGVSDPFLVLPENFGNPQIVDEW